jgi:hypothetical protein
MMIVRIVIFLVEGSELTDRSIPGCQRGVFGSPRPSDPEEERHKGADGKCAIDDEQGDEEPFDLLVSPDRRETAVEVGTCLRNEGGRRV